MQVWWPPNERSVCWNDEPLVDKWVDSIVSKRELSRQHGVFVYLSILWATRSPPRGRVSIRPAWRLIGVTCSSSTVTLLRSMNLGALSTPVSSRSTYWWKAT